MRLQQQQQEDIVRATYTPPLAPWLAYINLSVHAVPLDKKKSDYTPDKL